MTDTEHRAMVALGERIRDDEPLTATEYDEYLDLAALGGRVPAQRG
jgi:hypothetical protein